MKYDKNMKGRIGLYYLISQLNKDLSENNFQKKTIRKSFPKIIENNLIINYEEGVEYYMSETIYIENGGSLTINEGVKIIVKYDKENPVYLAVQNTGMLKVFGNDKDPVIFTSEDDKAGAWGGIIICGTGRVVRNEDGLRIEDNLTGHDDVLTYGGGFDFSKSCDLSFLIIKNAGFSRNGKDFAALSLYGVGYESMFDNIAILNSGGNGVEIRGGLFNMRRLFIKDCVDNGLDISQGFGGKFINTVIYNNLLGFKSALHVNTNNIENRHFDISGQDYDIIFQDITCVSKVGGIALNTEYNTKLYIHGITILGYGTGIRYVTSKDNELIEVETPNFLAHERNYDFSEIKFPYLIIIIVNPPQPLQHAKLPDPNIIQEFNSYEFENIVASNAIIENWASNYFS